MSVARALYVREVQGKVVRVLHKLSIWTSLSVDDIRNTIKSLPGDAMLTTIEDHEDGAITLEFMQEVKQNADL